MSEEENKSEISAQDFLTATSENDHICPRCGRDQNIKEAPAATEEEVKEYVRCLLSGETYEKSYALFKGQINVAFRSIDTETSAKLGKLLDSVPATNNRMADNERYLKIRLLFYLRQLQDKKFEITEADSLEAAEADFNDRFGKIKEDYLALIMRALMQFQNLLALLSEAGFDEGFWQGAGLD